MGKGRLVFRKEPFGDAAGAFFADAVDMHGAQLGIFGQAEGQPLAVRRPDVIPIAPAGVAADFFEPALSGCGNHVNVAVLVRYGNMLAVGGKPRLIEARADRKSTRLNSS